MERLEWCSVDLFPCQCRTQTTHVSPVCLLGGCDVQVYLVKKKGDGQIYAMKKMKKKQMLKANKVQKIAYSSVIRRFQLHLRDAPARTSLPDCACAS